MTSEYTVIQQKDSGSLVPAQAIPPPVDVAATSMCDVPFGTMSSGKKFLLCVPQWLLRATPQRWWQVTCRHSTGTGRRPSTASWVHPGSRSSTKGPSAWCPAPSLQRACGNKQTGLQHSPSFTEACEQHKNPFKSTSNVLCPEVVLWLQFYPKHKIHFHSERGEKSSLSPQPICNESCGLTYIPVLVLMRAPTNRLHVLHLSKSTDWGQYRLYLQPRSCIWMVILSIKRINLGVYITHSIESSKKLMWNY